MANDARDTRPWRRWSETEARTALAELERTGESDAAFARRHGVSTQRLRYWRKQVAATGRPAFVAVKVPEAKVAAEEIAIRIDGISVCLREDFDVEHLARIVDALARRSRAC
jgi:transposase-like protein